MDLTLRRGIIEWAQEALNTNSAHASVRNGIIEAFKKSVEDNDALKGKDITLSQEAVDELVKGVSADLKAAIEENHVSILYRDQVLRMMHDEEWEYLVADAYVLELPILGDEVKKGATISRATPQPSILNHNML